mmetsp:Transcript_15672/g.20471  ORF Transcript_15672/g.20471 Transcript_15672/m.20471 type:complete len:197 (+) Transcript_15672:77-667(+)
MDNPTPYELLIAYSELRYKEATDLNQYIIDEINKAPYNKKDLATVDSYKLMVKIIDLQGDEIRRLANENVKSFAAMQTDLSYAYFFKANKFEDAISKIPNSRRSTNRIFKKDAWFLRDQADELFNNANTVTSPQDFSRSMANFYQYRSDEFAKLAKSSRSFQKDVLLEHSKLLSNDSKFWKNVSSGVVIWAKRALK